MAPEWRGFGEALRLPNESLSNIHSMNQFDPKECLRSVLKEYFKKNYNTKEHGLPSWRKIVEAVSHRAGGNNSTLAQKIAEKRSMELIILHFHTSCLLSFIFI